MSKRKKAKNHVDVDVNGVEVLENLKEETEDMKNKKESKGGVKEFINGLPTPVKVVGGVIIGAATIGGTVLAVVSKVKGSREDDTDDYEESEESSYETTDAETEAED